LTQTSGSPITPSHGNRCTEAVSGDLGREGNFGYAVARAYAGHTDSGGDVGPTATYVRAGANEIAAALATLTAEAHPLT